jgi:three-Cys-motif partner protein
VPKQDPATPWAGKVGSTSRQIFIVDTFAGAGTYPDSEAGKRVDGSPVLAARYATQRPGNRLGVLAIEKHRGNFSKLEARLGGFEPKLVKAAPRRLGLPNSTGSWSKSATNPILLILDPLGLKSMPAEITQRILHREGKTDAFVTVHLGVVHRCAGQLFAGAPQA